MQTFAYTAISPNGLQRTKGKMQAPTSALVSEALQVDGWIPLSITPIATAGLNADVFALVRDDAVRLTIAELAAFARQLAELLKAGVPLGRALSALGEDADPKITKVCTDLAEKTSSGVSFSEALKAHPKAFDNVFRSYVAAGEAAGTLPTTMARLSRTLEKRAAMALKIKSASSYPKMVGGTVALIVLGILQFLLPMFANIYAQFGADLPAATSAMISFSNNMFPVRFDSTLGDLTPWFLMDDADVNIFTLVGRFILILAFWGFMEWWRTRRGKNLTTKGILIRGFVSIQILLFSYKYDVLPVTMAIYAGVIGAIVGTLTYIRVNEDNPKIGPILDKLKFSTPVFGAIWFRSALYRWTSTLAGALESGVNLVVALDIAARTSGVRWLELVTPQIQDGIRGGRPLSACLQDHKDLFMPQVRAMVTTGEAAGDLPVMLDSVADVIDGEIDSLMAGLSSKLEVILLIVMGVIVGGMLMVLYLPILNLSSAASGGL